MTQPMTQYRPHLGNRPQHKAETEAMLRHTVNGEAYEHQLAAKRADWWPGTGYGTMELCY